MGLESGYQGRREVVCGVWGGKKGDWKGGEEEQGKQSHMKVW